MANARKSRQKKLLVVGIVVLVIVVLVIAKAIFGGTGETFVSQTTKLVNQKTGSFRYVFDIRTDKHENNKSSKTATDLADLENMKSDKSTDEILEEYKDDEKQFVEWDNKEGVKVVDWQYPKYKVILEGSVKSTDPLEMNMTISLATNYFNDALTDIIVKGNKTYINIEQLRYWLSNSKDENLIQLGLTLPESAKYVEYEGDAFNLYSTYAEESEKDVSRESSIDTLYNRLIIAYSTVLQQLSIPSDCFSEEDGIQRLSVNGENSVSLVNSVKSGVLNIGDLYKSVIKNQYSNKQMTDDQYKQAQRETDNVVSAFSNLGVLLNTIELDKIDLKAEGNAREYTGGTGANIYESSLALQFTANETDYSVAIQLYKSLETKDVEDPKGSTISIDSFKDKDFVEKYLLSVLDYLNITGFDLSKQLEVTPSSIKENALSQFVELVNEVNGDSEDFTPVTMSTVSNFIDGYRNFKVKDSTSETDMNNANMVSDMLQEFSILTPKKGDLKESDSDFSDTERFPSLSGGTDSMKVYADLDKKESNTRLAKVDCYILNTGDSDLELKASDFTLQTMQSSKYPANFISSLKEYDGSFDESKAPETIGVSKGGYTKVSLYFVLANGLEYMDLWYGDTNLGVVVAN